MLKSRSVLFGIALAGFLQLAPEAEALPTEAFLVASAAPRAGRVASVVAADTARVSGEALQVIRLPIGIASTALGILPGVRTRGGSNIARGLAAPFRTAGAILRVPGHVLGAAL